MYYRPKKKQQIRSSQSSTRRTDQIDHDLDHQDPNLQCRYAMLCRICIVQIQPRKHVLDHADYTRLSPGNMSSIIQIRNLSTLPGRSRSSSGNRSYRSYRSYRSGIYLPCLADLDHELWWEPIIIPRCGAFYNRKSVQLLYVKSITMLPHRAHTRRTSSPVAVWTHPVFQQLGLQWYTTDDEHHLPGAVFQARLLVIKEGANTNDTSSESSRRDGSNADHFGTDTIPTVEISTTENRSWAV